MLKFSGELNKPTKQRANSRDATDYSTVIVLFKANV